MENKKKGHLSLEDRQVIASMSERGAKDSEIGRVIGRHRSVIWRERRRNRAPLYLSASLSPLERAKWSNDKAKRRRSDSKRGKRGRLKLAAVRKRIENLLEQGHYSPETIATIISGSDLGVKLSGRTIRRWLQSDARELRKHLPCRGKKYRTRLTRQKKSARTAAAAPEKRSIHERPAIVNCRARAGDLEGDLIVCKKSKVAILSVIDRKTRRRWYRKVKNHTAETVLQALIALLLTIPATERHSITFDRGGEFADWPVLEKLFGILVYFCDPYCAWQKGSVEHANKEFRRFVPKGTDLALVSDQTIAEIEALLNAKPMDCLGQYSAYQAWNIECAGTFLN